MAEYQGEPGSLARGSPVKQMSNLNISPRPKKRATSLKKPKRRFLENVELEEMRPRTSSLPSRNDLKKPVQYLSPYSESAEYDSVYTLRSFVTTSKGRVVNRGDSLRSRSTNSVLSSGSGSMTELTPLSRTSSSLSQSSVANSTGSAFGINPFKVLVVGTMGVGKTSIARQFTTSDYLGDLDISIDGERERVVSVLLDGEESTIDFLDPDSDETDWRLHSEGGVDAFVVVFSIDERATFEKATDLLFEIRHVDKMNTAIILVANKCDLVRTRDITTEEAKSVAKTYDCKYTETSVVLNHNVDELLVGIVSQIRLKRKVNAKKRDGKEEGCYSKSKHLLTKIFKKEHVTKSCENLYVL
ncbi:GTP-binding protein GEM-like [Haliotis rufescens]|uniref:GTP-binding protein GEM-like n=1 Tax=Haliotis rufescens TaxID=6454 RepID=UPI001EAFE16F|nr:GTP-binding protein GEM-like [Haliotis rufescens]